MNNITTVQQLIDRLKECDPEAEIVVYFDNKIADVMEIGGNSFRSKEAVILTEKDATRIYG